MDVQLDEEVRDGFTYRANSDSSDARPQESSGQISFSQSSGKVFDSSELLANHGGTPGKCRGHVSYDGQLTS